MVFSTVALTASRTNSSSETFCSGLGASPVGIDSGTAEAMARPLMRGVGQASRAEVQGSAGACDAQDGRLGGWVECRLRHRLMRTESTEGGVRHFSRIEMFWFCRLRCVRGWYHNMALSQEYTCFSMTRGPPTSLGRRGPVGVGLGVVQYHSVL